MRKCPSCGMWRAEAHFIAWHCDHCDKLMEIVSSSSEVRT